MTTQDTAPITTGTGESATDSPVIRREDPLGSIRAMAAAHNNWGRWGQDDVLGTLNFIDAAKRIEAAALVKTGEAFSLSQPFDTNGPQKGWRRRTNPVSGDTVSAACRYIHLALGKHIEERAHRCVDDAEEQRRRPARAAG